MIENLEATVPDAPAGVTATAGDTAATVNWTAPDDGGLPITGFTATADPGGATCTAGSLDTSCVVDDLTNGTAYSFTVVATNAMGDGPSSDPSVAVTPLPPECETGGVGAFPDVPADHGFCTEIEWLVDEGITTGYDDGTFRPTTPVDRQSMAAFLYRAAGSPNGPDPTCTTAAFPDVPANHLFCGEIDWLVDEGITTGYDDGTFRPTTPVDRQSMAAFLYRAA
jgi:hypothetical protein